jgi:iron(III) transport system substrate-binding protein
MDSGGYRLHRRAWLAGAGGGLFGLLGGCSAGREPELIVYSALDREFAAPVLDRYERQTGVRVRPVFDVESTKTVGLTQRLLAEARRPRCDLFWNNEVLNTIRLQRAGLLQPVELAAAERFPPQYRDPEGHWYGLAARARILLVNTERVPAAERPVSGSELLEDRWTKRFGFAKPLFGTTATHAACTFAMWGRERAEEFWRTMLARGHMLGGNRQVARAVAAGQLDCGWTDTDDALAELAEHAPVTIVYPDQGPAQDGVLFIPNTVAVIARCPHQPAAEALLEYLLDPEVETALAGGPSGQIPLAADVTVATQTATPATVRAWQVDFHRAADVWDECAGWLADRLQEGPARS